MLNAVYCVRCGKFEKATDARVADWQELTTYDFPTNSKRVYTLCNQCYAAFQAFVGQEAPEPQLIGT